MCSSYVCQTYEEHTQDEEHNEERRFHIAIHFIKGPQFDFQKRYILLSGTRIDKIRCFCHLKAMIPHCPVCYQRAKLYRFLTVPTVT